MKIKKHMKLLGLKVKDRVTGFSGIVTTVSFDLYGCIQVAVTPAAFGESKGELKTGMWFDVTRLIILDENPVMELPDFKKGYVGTGKKGCADKTMP